MHSLTGIKVLVRCVPNPEYGWCRQRPRILPARAARAAVGGRAGCSAVSRESRLSGAPADRGEIAMRVYYGSMGRGCSRGGLSRGGMGVSRADRSAAVASRRVVDQRKSALREGAWAVLNEGAGPSGESVCKTASSETHTHSGILSHVKPNTSY